MGPVPLSILKIDREVIPLLLVGFAREVLVNPGFGTEKSLFFTAPDGETNGVLRFGSHGFEDAHGLHHGGHAVGVVGCADAGVPGIDVRAQHDHLIS